MSLHADGELDEHDEKAVLAAQVAALSTLIEHLQTEAEISANREVTRKAIDVSLNIKPCVPLCHFICLFPPVTSFQFNIFFPFNQNAAQSQIEDLKNQLNSAITERDQAREEALAATAKLKELEAEIAALRGNNPSTPPRPSFNLQIPTSNGSNHVSPELSPGRLTPSPGRLTPGRLTPRSLSRALDGTASPDLSSPAMDRRQKELVALQHQLMQEKRNADQETLLTVLRSDLGFVGDRPIAAVLIFRCCLEWKAFQADRAPLFDRINQTMNEQVEVLQDDNSRLAYWMTNAVALIHLIRSYVKPAAASPTKRRQSTGGQQQSSRGVLGSAGKNLSAALGRAAGQSAAEDGEEQPDVAASKVQAHYPGTLFKQQLDAFVQRIFPILRDNVKNEISLHLAYCIHDPLLVIPSSANASEQSTPAAGATPDASAAATLGVRAPATPPPTVSESWKHVLGVFDSLLSTVKENHVPPFLARKLFEQLFSSMNVTLFNQLMLRRECCSFSNGSYVNSGLEALEHWVKQAGQEWTGAAWEQLATLRQSVTFLVMNNKERKNVKDIMHGVCPALSSQQLYRLSTLYWDDAYGTESLSPEVQAELKEMTDDKGGASGASNSFLLDDDSTLPFAQEDVMGLMDGKELLGVVPLPIELDDTLSFSFLRKEVDLTHLNSN